MVSVLLIYLVLRVGGVFDVERRSEIFRMLSGTHLGFLAASLVIPFALNFSSALKWHMLLRVKQSSPGLLLREFFVLFADSDIFSPHEVISVPSNGWPSNACSKIDI